MRGREWGLALVGLALVAGCGSDERPEPEAAAGSPVTQTIEKAVPRTDLSPVATATQVVGNWLAVDGAGVWVSGDADVSLLAGASGRKVATVNVPQGLCLSMATGYGALWTATCGTPGLARIDTKARKLTRHVKLPVPSALGGEGGIATGEDSVWVPIEDDEGCSCVLARIDPRTGRVRSRIPLGASSAAVRIANGSAWVTRPLDGTVLQIDTETEKVVRTIKAGAGPRYLAVGAGALWVLGEGDGEVTRIDPRTGATTSIDTDADGPGTDITTGDGSVWVRGTTGSVIRIDAATNEVAERYLPEAGVGGVAIGFGALWFSSQEEAITRRVPLGET